MSIFYRQLKSMGTRLEFVIPALEESAGLTLIRAIKDALDELVSHISCYDRDSVISRINRDAGDREIEVTGHLYNLLAEGVRYHALTSGYYDFTLGGWTSRPDLIKDTGTRFAALTSIPFSERISLKDHAVRFQQRDVRIDPGGIGKGMAMKIIEKMVRDAGISRAFISFGGSCVTGIGQHPYGDEWKVGIPHPEKEGPILAEVGLYDRTLSISGNSKNNRRKFGDQGHILNPHTGTFFVGQGLLAVVAEDPVCAEVLSTALIAAGPENEQQILDHFPDITVHRLSNEQKN